MAKAMGNHRGLRRIVNATRFSIAGLRSTWVNEPAFRQECLLALVLIPTAFWLGQSAVERALLILPLLLVLIVELLNSAGESIVDRIGSERHHLSGRAKDQGSAAVLVSLLLAGIVWGLVAWERFT